MSNPSLILGEWTMRRGDRLPMLSVVLEDDAGRAVDITGAKAYLQLRCEDGSEVLTVPDGITDPPLIEGWLVLEAYIFDAANGVVVYDWPSDETAGLTVGVDEIVIGVRWPDGRWLTVPSSRDARLIVRPALLPPNFT